ncbi:AAA family ATPase [bacterium]|nr:AAA family ATPase [bacterium]
MIFFKTLRYRNFLSTGDSFTEIDLNRNSSTLVVGQNGAGKSTMLDALSFGLFGKAHRNVNKPQLVNSINQKNCLVEVEFSVNGSDYKIARGIKPVCFEIWKDGSLINQDSHNKEYQQVLERNILKLNHKSFHQIVVLGSSSFVPFMQLPSHVRRDVIEDLLDINVFSKMNNILKERNSILKENVRANSADLETIEMKVKTQRRYVEKLHNLNKEAKAEKLNEIKSLEYMIQDVRSTIDLIDQSQLNDLKDQSTKTIKSISEVEKYDYQFGVKQKELNKEILFYENNTTCPTCDQGIGEGLKQEKTETATKKWDDLEDGRHVAAGKVKGLRETLTALENSIAEISARVSEADKKNMQITEYQRRITEIQNQLVKFDESTGDIENAEQELKVLSENKHEVVDQKSELADKASYHIVITEMLKDTGIKTKIIKQYLPVINNLTNKYLQVLDFYVSFHLDDTFKETIKSRHRDAFSYDSFSEGEKQRIDLALLFTWRQVAKMKNSVATNLLILDETFDSSLDAEGVDNLTKILDTLDNDTNVFIISHKGEMLDGKFESKIEFVKRKNFSQVA